MRHVFILTSVTLPEGCFALHSYDTKQLAAFSHRVAHDHKLDYRVVDALMDMVCEAEMADMDNFIRASEHFESPASKTILAGVFARWILDDNVSFRDNLRVKSWTVTSRTLKRFLTGIAPPDSPENAEETVETLAYMAKRMNLSKDTVLIEAKVASLTAPSSLLGKRDWSKALSIFADSTGKHCILEYRSNVGG